MTAGWAIGWLILGAPHLAQRGWIGLGLAAFLDLLMTAKHNR